LIEIGQEVGVTPWTQVYELNRK